MNIPYFDNFKTVNYDIDGEGNYVNITDLTPNIIIANSNTYSSYLYYNIKDGERPDVISSKLYGTPEYHWTIFVVNDHLRNGLNMWPYSYNGLSAMIDASYNKYAAVSFRSPTSEEIGSFAYLDLSKRYSDILRIRPSDNPNSYASDIKYDFQRCQCIFDVNSITGESADNFVNHDSYNIYATAGIPVTNPGDKPIGDSYAAKQMILEWETASAAYIAYTEKVRKVNEWNDLTKFKYGIETDPIDIKYKSAGPTYSWSLYSNAAYQYYIYDSLTGERETYSAFDAIHNNVSTYISYIEKEQFENDKLETIKVIRPDYIKTFVKEYFNILNSTN